MDRALAEEVRVSGLIAPAFYPVHADVRRGGHARYWLPGGRGSGKSSFVGVELPLCLMRDGQAGRMTHAVALRRYGVTLRESVFAQLLWGIQALGAAQAWSASVSPMALTYLPTGQKILFRGADDAMKVKSIKVDTGYVKYAWYEEVDEFEGEESVRSIDQSLMRGGASFAFFYTFNPPRSAGSWCNRRTAAPPPGTLVVRSDYRGMPPQWLGEPFLAEAAHLAATRPEVYAHEYLGEPGGTGGEVFRNVTLRPIPDGEIARFDHIRRGLDWGYAADPLAYNEGHYDPCRRRLYLYRELHALRLSNRRAAQVLLPWAGTGRIVCDSAEPKSIEEMRGYGLRVTGARKGPDSVAYGVKWLQDLEEIVIDPERCPETAREFTGYALARDREGRLMSVFPDRDDHHIDAVRYACEADMRRPAVAILR